MSINVEMMIGDLINLPSYPEKSKNESCANNFLADVGSLIKGYIKHKEPRLIEVEEIFLLIVSSNKPWNIKINALLGNIARIKYEELTDAFSELFDICEKVFNENNKTNPKQNVSLKSTKFKLYFDRNDFWFEPTDFEHFKQTIKNVTGRDVEDNKKYSKREIIHYMVVYLEKLRWRNKLNWLDSLKIEMENIYM
jgi:hypothetical protein